MNKGKTFILISALCSLLCLKSQAAATDIYISQGGVGSGINCGSPKDLAFFNASGNWGSGAGQIGPGTTVHLCGTFTNSANGDAYLQFQGSGSPGAGNRITLLFEPGAVIQAPSWDGGAIYAPNISYITIDGGSNGIIRATDNGYALGLQDDGGKCITATNGSNVTIQNLTCANMYVHVCPSGVQASCPDEGGGNTAGFYTQDVDHLRITNCTLHDTRNVIAVGFSNALNYSTIEIDHNTLYNVNIGIEISDNQTSNGVDTILVHDNNIYNGQNWTDLHNWNHHDGIHLFTNHSGPLLSNFQFYNNYIHGMWGDGINAFVFIEDGGGDGTITHAVYYNNVLVDETTVSHAGNGLMSIGGNYPTLVNNTMENFSGIVWTGLNASIKNNITIGSYEAMQPKNNGNVFTYPTDFDHNIYYGIGVGGWKQFPFSYWQANYGDVNGAGNSDPGINTATFVPSFAGSLAVGFGLNLTSLGITALNSDKAGLARPASGAWDAGAYQFAAAPPPPPNGSNFYIAQNAAGSANGSSCANAKAVSFFNTGSNWGAGAGQIGPGTTVHLCGTITAPVNGNALTFHGSGTSGQPITLFWEPGSKVSSPACDECISTNSNANLVLDGNNTHPSIENTANGTSRANQVDSHGIVARVCDNCEFKNLTFSNIFVSVNPANAAQGFGGCLYIYGSHWSIHDSSCSEAYIGFNSPYRDGDNSSSIYRNTFYHDNWGVSFNSNSTYLLSSVSIHDNVFGDMDNWDNPNFDYHHNGIHIYQVNDGTLKISNVFIYNNTFQGKQGLTLTAWVFADGGMNGVYVFNNTMVTTDGTGFAMFLGYYASDQRLFALNNYVDCNGGNAFRSYLTDSVTLKNNVFKNCTIYLYTQAGTVADETIDYNAYDSAGSAGSQAFNLLGGGQPFTPYRAEFPQFDAHTITPSNFGMDGSFKPQAGSPLIGAGTNLSGLGITALNSDKAGNARPGIGQGNWDIGAYESGGTPPPPDTTAPSVPSGLLTTPASSSQINLTWADSTDNVGGSGMAGYKVYRCQGTGCTPATQIATPGTNSYSDTTGLSASTVYTYKVAAYDLANNTSALSSAASATTLAGLPPGCTQSNASWQNFAFTSQSAPFTVTYDDTPGTSNMDGVTGLSLNAATAYGNMAVITRFHDTGFIDAINGGNYAALTPVSYSAGTTYHFRVVVNPQTHTYSAYVTPAGLSEVQIANSYAFRTEQAATSSLNNWTLYSDVGTHSVCNFALGGTPLNQAPTVFTSASATPSPVTGMTTSVSVLGADDGGEPNLTYTWATTGTPPAPVTYSITTNGTNAAKMITANFTKAGAYSFQVTIRDAGGLTVPSSVNVTVNATLTSIIVSPSGLTTLQINATQLFSAAAKDQFGAAMTLPTMTWSVSGGGTINSASGLFTAGSVAAPGPFTVTATGGGKSGTAQVSVTTSNPPTVTLTSPANNAMFTAPATINLAATVSPGTNPISKVDFYQGTTLLNSDASSPYSFTWPNVPAGSYAISAVVTDSQGLTNPSNVANVMVNTAAPVITLQPQDQSKTVGQTATFTITATGSGLSYQWEYFFANNWYAIPGAINSAYSIANVQMSNDGVQYQCVVTNGGGSILSSPATMHVTSSGTGTNPLPAIDPGNLPSYAGLNDHLSITNYPNSNVSFLWTFGSTTYGVSSSEFRVSGLNAKRETRNPPLASAPSANFTTGAQTSALASYGLTLGTYQVTVQAQDAGNNTSPTLTATITLVNADFSALKVYPNPWRSDKHAGKNVIFANLPLGATVKLFTVSGHLVKTITPNIATATWDLTNDSGDKVASGIYVYLITTGDTGYGGNGQKVKGKVAVIK